MDTILIAQIVVQHLYQSSNEEEPLQLDFEAFAALSVYGIGFTTIDWPTISQSVQYCGHSFRPCVCILYVKSRAKNQSFTTKSCILRLILFTTENIFDDARTYTFVAIYGVFAHTWVNRANGGVSE